MIYDKVPVVFVDFPDLQDTFSGMEDKFFSDNIPSLKTYFKEISYGQFIPDGITTLSLKKSDGSYYGVIRMPESYFYYANSTNINYSKTDLIINEVLSQVGCAFPLSFDVDKDEKLPAMIIVIPASAVINPTDGKWWFLGFGAEIALNHQYMCGYQKQLLNVIFDSKENLSGIFHYYLKTISPGNGWLDLMDWGPEQHKMCGYSLQEGNSPLIHIDAWSKYLSGWTKPRINPTGKGITLKAAEKYNDFIIYTTDNPLEYYILENRQSIGYDNGKLPGYGLVIYHVIDPNTTPNTSCSTNAYITMILAGNRDYNSPGGCYNLDEDVFPGSKNIRIFSKDTTPGTNLCDAKLGTYLDLTISNISDSGETMTFDVSNSCPTVDCDFTITGDMYVGEKITITANDNSILETGHAWYWNDSLISNLNTKTFSVNLTSVYIGTHTIRHEGTNSCGNTCSKEKTITITKCPTVDCDFTVTGDIIVGKTISITASDTSILTHSWYWNGNLINNSNKSTIDISLTEQDVGTNIIRHEGTNSCGNTCSKEKTITLTAPIKNSSDIQIIAITGLSFVLLYFILKK